MDVNILRILIESDRNRKLTAFMMYYFWQNDIENIKTYLTEYATKDGMFSAESAKLLPKIHRDITNKVLNNRCAAYHSGVDRYLVKEDGTVDEEQTALLNEVYEMAGVTQAQKDWYKAGRLFNCVEVRPIWRKKANRIEFDIWTPNWFSVWENAESKYVKDTILFDLTLVDDFGNEREVFDVWSDTEHYYLVPTINTITIAGKTETLIKYVKETVTDNENDINPYGVIPSVELRFKRGEDYFGVGMLDLVEENIWHDIDISNQKWVKFCQGMGIILAVNTGITNGTSLKPNSIVSINDVKQDMDSPTIDAIGTNAPITELDASSKENIEQIMLMNGLSGQTATVKNSNASGVSKAFDFEEIELLRLDDKDILKDFEKRLFEVFRKVYNYRTTGTKLDEKLSFVCDFIERVTPLNESDKIAKAKFELEQGLTSKVNYLIEANPDLTEQEAIEELKENEKIRKQFPTEIPAGANGGNQNPNPATGLNQ